MRQQIERAIAHGEIHAAHHQSDQQRHVFATPHQQRRETNQNATSSQMYVGMNSRRAMTSDTSMTPSVGFRRMFLCSGYMPTVGRAGVR